METEIRRLQQWVADLQSGMYVNCVYCGHRYGPKDEVPSSMAEVLKEHIEQCPEHPMSKLKGDLEAVREQLAEDESVHQWNIGFEDTWNGERVEKAFRGSEGDAIVEVDDMLRAAGIETWVTLDE